MRKSIEVLKILCDGRRHSGATIAASLTITRAAVWERIRVLRHAGLAVEAQSGIGYQLPYPIELLSAPKIRAAMTPSARKLMSALAVLETTDSTNQRLLELAEDADIHGHVCLAEAQTRGRGRRGDSWSAPLAGGLYLSLGWRFDRQPATFAALGLMVGVCVVETLAQLNVPGLGLKWPNDIVAADRKLGGILIELRSELSGPTLVVLGIGINTALPESILAGIDQPAIDVLRLTGEPPVRNRIAALLVSNLFRDLARFANEGFKPWRRRWESYDVLRNKPVKLVLPDTAVSGIAMGVNDSGALLLRADGRVQSFFSGSVTRL